MEALYTLLVAAVGLACVGSIGYLLALLMAAARQSETPAQAAFPAEADVIRFAVLIPAHDEELVLAATLDSLRAQNYPLNSFEVVVVADNCADATADIARARGATTLERINASERGKGYALDWALSQLLSRPAPANAFVIVDADTWVAPNFLSAMAARLRANALGSENRCALQGRYGVLNPEGGWRAALMAGAFDLFNHVKPLGRDHLGLSVGLKGNGMAFSLALLSEARWRGDSVTEDIDYGLDLARHHGIRVGYVPEARVLAQMPTTAAQAASQRDRWEGGRYRLLRKRGLPLLWEGMRRRSFLLCDAALDLMLPPLAELAAFLVLWGALIAVGAKMRWLLHPQGWAVAAAVTALGLMVYILAGFRISGAPRAAYLALLRAPLYAVWKFCLYAARPLRKKSSSPGAAEEWVRTERAPLPPAPESIAE